MKLNEGSVAITHGEIEYLLVFLKNKNSNIYLIASLNLIFLPFFIGTMNDEV